MPGTDFNAALKTLKVAITEEKLYAQMRLQKLKAKEKKLSQALDRDDEETYKKIVSELHVEITAMWKDIFGHLNSMVQESVAASLEEQTRVRIQIRMFRDFVGEKIAYHLPIYSLAVNNRRKFCRTITRTSC